MDDAPFYAILHDHPSEQFIVGPFPSSQEARAYLTIMRPGLKCRHKLKVIPGTYGSHQIVSTAVVIAVEDENSDHLN